MSEWPSPLWQLPSRDQGMTSSHLTSHCFIRTGAVVSLRCWPKRLLPIAQLKAQKPQFDSWYPFKESFKQDLEQIPYRTKYYGGRQGDHNSVCPSLLLCCEKTTPKATLGGKGLFHVTLPNQFLTETSSSRNQEVRTEAETMNVHCILTASSAYLLI